MAATSPTSGTAASTATEPSAASHPAPEKTAVRTSSGDGDELVTRHGRTTIADTVVEKIAGMAARQVDGVYRLGGAASQTISALRERIPGGRPSYGQGVAVEVGERQAAVDLDVVVEYGYPIGPLAKTVRRSVINAVETMTTLEVTEVNIAVNDVHIPGDDDDSSGTSRVQ